MFTISNDHKHNRLHHLKRPQPQPPWPSQTTDKTPTFTNNPITTKFNASKSAFKSIKHQLFVEKKTLQFLQRQYKMKKFTYIKMKDPWWSQTVSLSLQRRYDGLRDGPGQQALSRFMIQTHPVILQTCKRRDRKTPGSDAPGVELVICINECIEEV